MNRKGKQNHILWLNSSSSIAPQKKGKNKEVIDTLEKRVPECLLSKSQHFMHRCLYKHFLNANSSIWGSKIQQGTRKTFVD